MARGVFVSSMADLSDIPSPEAFYTYGLPAVGTNQGKMLVYNGTTWQLTTSTGTISVQEADGSPNVSNVATIKVSNGTLTDNGSGVVTVVTGGGGGGTNARSAVDPATASYISDDFSIDGATAGIIGQLRWYIGNGSVTVIASETNHPGIAHLSAAAVGNITLKDTTLTKGRDQTLFSESFDSTWILRLNGTLANVGCRVGFVLSTLTSTANPPTDGIFLEKLGGDTNWFGVVRAASAQTRTDTLTAASTNFIRLRIRRIDASTIGFTAGGASEVTSTATQPTGTVFCYMQIIPSGTQTIDIDFFDLLIGLAR